MPNINITLPDDVHKQLKLKALLADKPLKDFFIETLERRVTENTDSNGER